MGKPAQLTKEQSERLKKESNGEPILKENIKINTSGLFLKEMDIRENDVFLINLIKQ